MQLLQTLMGSALVVPVLCLAGPNEDAGLDFKTSPYAAADHFGVDSFALAAQLGTSGALEQFGLGGVVSPVTTVAVTVEHTSTGANGSTSCSTTGTQLTCSTSSNSESCSTTKSTGQLSGHQCSTYQNTQPRTKCSVNYDSESTSTLSAQCSAYGEHGDGGQLMTCSTQINSSGLAKCSVNDGGTRNRGKCSVTSKKSSSTQRCSVFNSYGEPGGDNVKCSVEKNTKGTCTVINGNSDKTKCSVHGGSSQEAGNVKCSTYTNTSSGGTAPNSSGKCSGGG